MDEEEIKRRVIFGEGVGYGKPPEQSQFKKGQSGNPKGRPRKTPTDLSLTDQPTLSAVLNIANKMVSVREDGRSTEMTIREAMAKATFASALKGNARSQALGFALLKSGEKARAIEIRGSNEFWSDYKWKVSAQIAEAQKQGLAVPTPLPHPDDIVIDHVNGPRFLGPIDETEQAMIDDTLRYRDVLIIQNALDRREGVGHDDEPGSAELLAVVFEHGIPPRLRLSTTQWALRAMKYESMSKRTLLKLLYESWGKLGRPLPRGFLFPDLNWMKNRISMVIGLLHDIRRLNLDPLKMTKHEWEETVVGLIERY